MRLPIFPASKANCLEYSKNMPIYEYHCNACGIDFEKLVFGANLKAECEQCGSARTEKRMSRFGMGKTSSSAGSSGNSGCGGCSSTSCAGCK